MKHLIQLPLVFSTLFYLGCEEHKTSDSNEKNTIEINKIEKNITKKNTNLGCNDKKHLSDKGCSEEMDSAKLILSTLEKESNQSLEEIDQLKENLIALVDLANPNRGKDLEKFINKIDEEQKLNREDPQKITLIKEALNDLVALETPTVKPKELKEKLNNLISNITESPSDKKSDAVIIKEHKNYYIIKVQEGDNLSILAQRYYNDKEKYKLIYQANKEKINSKYEIFLGMELLIPKI